MLLDDQEFLRRFLLHALIDCSMRVRHFGFLANRYKNKLWLNADYLPNDTSVLCCNLIS